MRGTLRAQSPEYNDKRVRELSRQFDTFQRAGSRPSQMTDLIRDLPKHGLGGALHRGPSDDGPIH